LLALVGLGFASLVSLSSGCGPRSGTDVGNGATVTFDAHGFERKPKAQERSLVLGSGDRVDELWIVVEKFRLSQGGACDTDEDVEDVAAEGPFVAEVLEGGIVGALPTADLTAGDYCRLRLDLHELREDEVPAGAPADLAGYAVLVRGERADGVPFVVRSKQGVEFKLDAKSGSFEVADGLPFLLGLELGSLIGSLELATLDGPSIVVDPETNPDQLKAFRDALRESVRLFEDQDRDGALSDTESAESEELAVGE
jgi:hypothetical protein